MGEYVSSYTGKKIDELLGMVDQNAFASADHTHESKNTIMYEGSTYMNTEQHYAFMYGKEEGEEPHKVSDQPHGIVLVFSYFDKDAENSDERVKDYAWSTHFVPKDIIANAGYHTFLMASNYDDTSITFGAKQLYISNTEIGGHTWNDKASASDSEFNNSDIRFANNCYVLRYVIGV